MMRDDLRNQTSLAGESYPVAVIVCAVGFFLRLILSAPVLNMLGINYGDDDADMLAKIHPGSYLIIISFFILLCSRHNPFEQTIRVARQQTAFFSFMMIYVIIIVYWIIRGPKGVGLIPDIHLVMPITAIVFSYAPRSYAKIIVYSFILFCLVNSAVGIFESLTHVRIFTFDPDWEVLKQDYFRASAFLGHPLTNAAFTGFAIFILLDLRLSLPVKAIAFLIMLCSLISFGGRSALIFSVIGLSIVGLMNLRKHLHAHGLSVLQLMIAVLSVICIPLFCLTLLYAALHSEMGERLLAYSSGEDESAGIRLIALHALNFMTSTDIIFGMDGEQITQLGLRAGVNDPTSDIENPWILMFMFLGALMFPLWLAGWAACIWRLMAGSSAVIKIAIMNYFFIASTSNSFGRKDALYATLAGIVVCAKQLESLETQKRRETTP